MQLLFPQEFLCSENLMVFFFSLPVYECVLACLLHNLVKRLEYLETQTLHQVDGRKERAILTG